MGMPIQQGALGNLFKAPTPKIMKVAEVLPVPCPYCQIGRAHLKMVASADGSTKEIHGMNEVHRCDTCNGEFTVQAVTNFVGVPIENGAPKQPLKL